MNEAIQYVALVELALRPQVRDLADDETIAALAASIAAVGLLQPIRVRREDDCLIVVDGERRFRAVNSLGWKQIAAIIEERELCPAEVIRRQLIANCQRKGLAPVEFARAMRDLIADTGYGIGEAAAACGFSAATVSRHLKLLEAESEVQEKVASGEIPASTAYEIAKVSDREKQVDLAREAAAGELNRDGVKRRAKSPKKRSGRHIPARPPRIVADLGGRRKVVLEGHGLTSIEAVVAWMTEALDAFKRALAAGCDLASVRRYVQGLNGPASV